MVGADRRLQNILRTPRSRLPFPDLDRTVTAQQRFLDGKSTIAGRSFPPIIRSVVRRRLRGTAIVSKQFTIISIT